MILQNYSIIIILQLNSSLIYHCNHNTQKRILIFQHKKIIMICIQNFKNKWACLVKALKKEKIKNLCLPISLFNNSSRISNNRIWNLLWWQDLQAYLPFKSKYIYSNLKIKNSKSNKVVKIIIWVIIMCRLNN